MKNLFKLPLLWLTFCLPFTLFSQNCANAINKGNALVDGINCEKKEQVKALWVQLKTILTHCLTSKDSMDSSLGDLYHKMGVLQFKCTGDYKVALFYLNLAIKNRTIHLGENHPETANSYYIRAANQYSLENNTAAIEDLKMAISCIEKAMPLNRDSILANYYGFAGLVYNKLADYHQAIRSSEKSIDLFTSKNDYSNYSYQHTLGKIYNNLQQQEKSIAYYKEALKYLQKVGVNKERYAYFGLLNDLGLVYSERNQNDLAFSYYQQALNNSEGADSMDIANTYANLVVLSANREVFDQSKEYFDKGLVIAQTYLKHDIHPTIAELHYSKGQADVLQGKYTTALKHFQKAIQILIPSFNPINVEQNPILNHHVVSEKRHLLTVLKLKAKAFQQKYKAEKGQGQIDDLDVALDTYITLDILLTDIRRGFRAAESKYFLQENIVEIYEQAILVARQLFLLTKNGQYQQIVNQFMSKNKAIILLEGMHDEKAKSKVIPDSILRKERNLKKTSYELEAAIYEATIEDTLKLLKDRLYQIERNYQLFIEELEEKYPSYHKLKYAYFSPISIREIQRKLAYDQAVVEIFVGKENLFVLTITKIGSKFYQSAILDQLEKNCIAFRAMTQGDSLLTKEKFSLTAYQLYQDLLANPLAGLPFFVNRLTIIPDDFLLQITFEAMFYKSYEIKRWSDKKIPYLLRKYAIGYAYSNRLFLNDKDSDLIGNEGKEFLGFGLEYTDYTKKGRYKQNQISHDSLTFKRNLGRLPYSDDEIREIAPLFKSDTFINQNATKKTFLDKANNYSIVHLATHGTVDEEAPLNSSVIFAKASDTTDNLLRASEVYYMKLNSNLIFLSACNTGYGPVKKGEGIRTLARAFTFAGSPNLIISLWSIRDFSTKDLATAFYQKLKSGHPKDIALQKAKLQYLALEDDSNLCLPSFWSQNILIGDSRPMYDSKPMPRWFFLILLVSVALFFVNRRYRI